jgi:hypothetical protein
MNSLCGDKELGSPRRQRASPSNMDPGNEWKSPKTLQSHRATATTTTPFKIDLMDLCMGNEAIHQPQQDSHHNQNFQKLD